MAFNFSHSSGRPGPQDSPKVGPENSAKKWHHLLRSCVSVFLPLLLSSASLSFPLLLWSLSQPFDWLGITRTIVVWWALVSKKRLLRDVNDEGRWPIEGCSRWDMANAMWKNFPDRFVLSAASRFVKFHWNDRLFPLLIITSYKCDKFLPKKTRIMYRYLCCDTLQLKNLHILIYAKRSKLPAAPSMPSLLKGKILRIGSLSFVGKSLCCVLRRLVESVCTHCRRNRCISLNILSKPTGLQKVIYWEI